MPLYSRYKDIEKRKEYNRNYNKVYMKAYRLKLKKLGIKRKWNESDYLQKVRRKAMDILGGAKCANCGCDNLKILEINHLNGGGHKELQVRRGTRLQQDIIKGRVDISKFNVLCRICNSLHYVETLLGIKGHRVNWSIAS